MEEKPFLDLPAALVDDALQRTDEISNDLLVMFNTVRENKSVFRDQLIQENLICRDSDLPNVDIPTSCGIDGTQAVERLLALDLIVVGAVASEGLTPPSENRFWPDPHHNIHIDVEQHEADISQILRGLMMGKELQLALSAPHDLIFLDGSFTTPLIFFNQSFSKIPDLKNIKISIELKNNCTDYLNAYKEILTLSRSDRHWVAIPKYTTKREIGNKLNWQSNFDDRGILSNILLPGEYTKPILLNPPDSPWHISTKSLGFSDERIIDFLVHEIISSIEDIFVVYYRPYKYLPAFRIEFSRSIQNNRARLSTVLQGIKYQCGNAAILEPYPLYMADRIVKHLARALPTLRQITSQQLAENYIGDISDIFLGLHGYRTETGG